jgi:hypothetical protein
VAQLKRLFMYNAHNKLLPGLQVPSGARARMCVAERPPPVLGLA